MGTGQRKRIARIALCKTQLDTQNIVMWNVKKLSCAQSVIVGLSWSQAFPIHCGRLSYLALQKTTVMR